MKFFIFIGVFLVFAAPAPGALQIVDDWFECTPGVNYIENRCNGCFCASKILACTAMVCPTHHDPKLTKCAIGTKWSEGCEICWCTKIWGTVCTEDCGRKQY